MPLYPSIQQALAFLVLCTAAYFVLARAEVTRFLWSRYPGPVARAARCAACGGFWIGAALGALLCQETRDLALSALLGGAWGIVVTPVGFSVLRSALEASSVVDLSDDPE